MRKKISIHTYTDYELLFEGTFENTLACIEAAVADKVNLAYADLQSLNLSNINLDDARMAYANFSGSNLSGANMSEGFFNGALFRETSLFNACFAYADLQNCDFSGADFGATDITGANISFSRFNTLSCFTLDFAHVRAMKGCRFEFQDGARIMLSQPPVVIKGLSKKPLILLQDKIFYGLKEYNYGFFLQRLRSFLSGCETHTNDRKNRKVSG